MKKNNLNYHLIHIHSIEDERYIFVTTSYNNLSDEDIIDICIEKGLFDKHLERAEIDYSFDENDIEELKDQTYNID